MTTPKKERIRLQRSQDENYTRVADVLGISESTTKFYYRWNNNILFYPLTFHSPTAICRRGSV